MNGVVATVTVAVVLVAAAAVVVAVAAFARTHLCLGWCCPNFEAI